MITTKKRMKGHKWYGNGMSCSCGPNGHFYRSQKKVQKKAKESWKAKMRTEPCHYCGLDGGTVDHVIPTSQGGKDTKANCVPACGPCNNFRKSLDYKWFKEVGWKTRSFA